MGDSVCAAVLVSLVNTGVIPKCQWKRMVIIYNQYCHKTNALWESNLDEKVKRHLDALLLSHTMESIQLVPGEHGNRTRMMNVISSHHKGLARKYKLRTRLKRSKM